MSLPTGARRNLVGCVADDKETSQVLLFICWLSSSDSYAQSSICIWFLPVCCLFFLQLLYLKASCVTPTAGRHKQRYSEQNSTYLKLSRCLSEQMPTPQMKVIVLSKQGVINGQVRCSAHAEQIYKGYGTFVKPCAFTRIALRPQNMLSM